MRLRWLCLCAPVCMTFSVGTAAATELNERLHVTLGYHYSSGTYGTSNTTEIMYVPLTATAEIAAGASKAPYRTCASAAQPGLCKGRMGDSDDERHRRRPR
jgi:hypothetical protein